MDYRSALFMPSDSCRAGYEAEYDRQDAIAVRDRPYNNMRFNVILKVQNNINLKQEDPRANSIPRRRKQIRLPNNHLCDCSSFSRKSWRSRKNIARAKDVERETRTSIVAIPCFTAFRAGTWKTCPSVRRDVLEKESRSSEYQKLTPTEI